MTKYKLKPNRKIEENVKETYDTIEKSVVDTYKKIEESAVSNYKKIENAFVERFLEKVDGESVNSNETAEKNR